MFRVNVEESVSRTAICILLDERSIFALYGLSLIVLRLANAGILCKMFANNYYIFQSRT